MKIACVLPYSSSRYRSHHLRDVLHNSYLIQISSYFSSLGFQTSIFDYLGTEQSSVKKMVSDLDEYRPDIIVVQPLHRIEDLGDIKSNFLSIPCIAVGPVCNDVVRCSKYVDFVFPINPEVGITDVINRILNEKFTNISAGSVSDKVIDWPISSSIDMDTILSSISPSSLISSNPHLAYVTTSRGCWYGKCTFCIVGAACKSNKSGWNNASPETVCNILFELQNMGVKQVAFLDAIFIGPNPIKTLEKYKELFNKFGITMKFHAYARVDTLKDPMVTKLLKELGFLSIFVGIDGINDKMLNRLNKGITYKDIFIAIDNLKATNIDFKFGWIIADRITTCSDLIDACKIILNSKLYEYFSPANLDNETGVGTFFHEMHINAGTCEYLKDGCGADTLSEYNVTYSLEVENMYNSYWPVRKALANTYRLYYDSAKTISEKRLLSNKYNKLSVECFLYHLEGNKSKMNSILSAEGVYVDVL